MNQQKEQMMICPHDCGDYTCGHRDQHARNTVIKSSGVAAISFCVTHYCPNTGHNYTCVLVEQLEPGLELTDCAHVDTYVNRASECHEQHSFVPGCFAKTQPQMMICNKAVECKLKCTAKRRHLRMAACLITCKWGGTCVPVEQVKPGFMIGCLHRDNCHRPCDMKSPFAASNLDVTPSCFTPVEDTEPKPPEYNLEPWKKRLDNGEKQGLLPTFAPMIAEIERLRNELAKAQKESKMLRSRRDHWRRTAGVNREMWLNRYDELQTAKGALAQTGIGGIYAEFDGLADAIQQMAAYLMEQEKLASEYIGAVGKVADIVDAPEMWPLDGLRLVTNKVSEMRTALSVTQARLSEAKCQRNDYRRLYEFLQRKKER